MHTATLKPSSDAQPLPRRVLVCEDNHLIANGWAMVLSDWGYEVVGPASTAEKALEDAYKKLPDIAIVDINLDGTVDGISVAAELAFLGVPIIFVTGDYQRAATEGRHLATDILIKPVNPDILISSITAVLEHKPDRQLSVSHHVRP
jgi:two-component system, response regulator PdtaR